MQICDLAVRRAEAVKKIKEVLNRFGYIDYEQAVDIFNKTQSWWQLWWGGDVYYDWKLWHDGPKHIVLQVTQNLDLENVVFDLRQIEKKYKLSIVVSIAAENNFRSANDERYSAWWY